MSESESEIIDRARGCLIGQFVGDAAGAPLEFYKSAITNDIVHDVVRMCGGGALNVAPGQFTDDSELAIHLLRAIHDKNPVIGFPLEEVAQEYIAWYQSHPFDMGRTCAIAFGFSKDATNMLEKSQRLNILSEANGALMRISPLAVWAHRLPTSILVDYACQDAMLSHPNLVCQQANATLCVAIAHLLNNPGDFVGASNAVDALAPSLNGKVRQWIDDSKLSFKTIRCDVNIGHVRHALTLALYFLRRNTDFQTAIFNTLLKGGDTDTNAAIVGALMGALHGYSAIPQFMRGPVEKFDCVRHDPTKTLLGYNRPETYRVIDAIAMLDKMLSYDATNRGRGSS